ncbi:MAG: hypothetical protein JAY75_00780 [Candidatus Thiodiazotropha taylori]|nr:hypothetical protein [Candidatus Thiodiazotropha taylori]MCW4261328.1 hypothetical protein [Candidatus Thiodiazotropha endolucinida]MCG8031528.1 hypothetical protein [Candidatus Thiodiazotropha taylori]MCG8074762.1 hypothetical protein [Candidatus Thiodiazotropha taylori]MCW4306738.1 hypothetical protein [Candidatus Thiodiazotropha endolucinida]
MLPRRAESDRTRVLVNRLDDLCLPRQGGASQTVHAYKPHWFHWAIGQYRVKGPRKLEETSPLGWGGEVGGRCVIDLLAMA